MITAILFLVWFGLLVLLIALHLYIKREVIERKSEPYLIRYFLWAPRDKSKSRLYLHHILRSDHDKALHDHPWSFKSLILWGGYWEHSLSGKKWYGPGSILKRPARFRHRLEVERSAWTIVFCGPKEREWGFWTGRHSWCHWTNYNSDSGLCEEGKR